ncbi:STAS domain-containing protein [Marinobacter sp. F3R08]|uniref:STAS domain-containing protein n=1 Tax=Marinobacter sp. F3R08 TaxID=2841559 RepID=UPI001C08D166|nr:STAS domain-containing protein [Marinobacter sp. F3R08]MBU2955897.1 STAS domain-containing protein [Marinobacter sp. F3R08]
METPSPTSNFEIIDLPPLLVMGNSDPVRKQLESRISAGLHRLILNLQPVEFMDSSGLSVLMSAWKKVKPFGGRVILVSPAPSVRALLELTRLHEIFEIYEDMDAAQADMAA